MAEGFGYKWSHPRALEDLVDASSGSRALTLQCEHRDPSEATFRFHAFVQSDAIGPAASWRQVVPANVCQLYSSQPTLGGILRLILTSWHQYNWKICCRTTCSTEYMTKTRIRTGGATFVQEGSCQYTLSSSATWCYSTLKSMTQVRKLLFERPVELIVLFL